MKKKISQKDLAELRKKELAKKEMEFEVGRDLKQGYEKMDFREKLFQNKSPQIIVAINFFGTLLIGYLLFLGLKIIIMLTNYYFSGFIPEEFSSTFFPTLHVVIWGLSVIAVARRRSPYDDFLDWKN